MNNQKLTFSSLLERYSLVEVPRLQRDYAQGRTDAKSAEIRSQLLDELLSGQAVDLGIIFGESREERDENDNRQRVFVPVDGQQRLTTLWLCLLYAHKKRLIDTSLLNRFTYETRDTSRQFCRALVHNDWPTECGDLKAALLNQQWFLWYWRHDPTADAMLNTLSDLHSKVLSGHPPAQPDFGNATFRFIDIGEEAEQDSAQHRSTQADELYMKMNSRGKQLTEFEKLKAHIEGLLPTDEVPEARFDAYPDSFVNTLPGFADKWRYAIDRQWSELFWDGNPVRSDNKMTSFFVNFVYGLWTATESSTLTEGHKITSELFKSIRDLDFTSESYYLPWEDVRKLLGSASECRQRLAQLARYLNLLCAERNRQGADAAFDSSAYTPLWPTNSTYDLLSATPTRKGYAERFVLLALGLYEGDSLHDAPGETALHDYLRFAWNMAQNYVRSLDRGYIGACGKLLRYAPHSTSILPYLASQRAEGEAASEEDFASGKLSQQEAEEVLKAKAMQSGEADRELVERAEAHTLLCGRIRPLLALHNARLGDWPNLPRRLEHFCALFDATSGQLCHNDERNSARLRLVRATLRCADSFERQLVRQLVFDTSVQNMREELLLKLNLEPIYARLLLADSLETCPAPPQDEQTAYITSELLGDDALQWAIGRSNMWLNRRDGDHLFLYRKGTSREENYLGVDSVRGGLMSAVESLAAEGKIKVANANQRIGPGLYVGRDIHFTHLPSGTEFVLVEKRLLCRADKMTDIYKGLGSDEITITGKRLHDILLYLLEGRTDKSTQLI